MTAASQFAAAFDTLSVVVDDLRQRVEALEQWASESPEPEPPAPEPPAPEPPAPEPPPPPSGDLVSPAADDPNDPWDGSEGYLLTPNWDKVPAVHPLTGVTLPTVETTGVPAGVTLTPSDSLTVDTNGAVIEGLDISGRVVIEADNVTMRNCRITSGGSAPVVRNNGRNFVIEDCRIRGIGGNPPGAIAYGNYTARRCRITGCRDAVKVATNTTLERCYISSPYKVGTSHSDGVQGSGGSNITIRNCVILGPYRRATSAIKLTGEQSDMSNVTIEGNYLSGGAFTLYTTSDDSYTTSGFEVHDNLIEAGSFMYGHRKNTAANVNESGTTLV